MIFEGEVRRITRYFSGTNPVRIRITDVGSQAVDLVKPRYAELARARKIYNGTSATGTAQAPVTAIPTTTATWALYNGNKEGSNICLLPLSAYCWSVSGTLGLGMSLLGTVALAEVISTKPTTYASSITTSFSGGANATRAVFASAVTMVGTPSWALLGSRDQVSAISVGSGIVAPMEGAMLIPPNYVGGFTVLAPVGTTALFGFGVTYAELELDLEG